ncbi:MAG: shikimate dehydrogenase [Deltaproteobacteria bacterium]|nr:shikimate dehydrogenase [Deltaproteobacteria bacterium]
MSRSMAEFAKNEAPSALCGILLHPAGHTRSPAMHNAAFRALGIEARYKAFDIHPEALPEAMEQARSLGFRQLAISIPHKEAVMALLDEVDETARQIGAVNTVTRVDDKLVGTNTDWAGAVHALERMTELAGRRVVILGAGGTAKALCYGLLRAGSEVTVLNRTEERAIELVQSLGAKNSGSLSSLSSLPADIIVNTTSVGLQGDTSPVPDYRFTSNQIVMDAIYGSKDSRFLRDAQARGAKTLQGKWMLIYQALEQLKIWTVQEAPVDVMEEAFDSVK